jgi:hypothetical protein
MKLSCPKCGVQIPIEEVNIAKDLARCTRCAQIYPASQLLELDDGVQLDAPPSGARFSRGADGFVVEATTRSPIAVFLVPFMCVWSGGSIVGIYGGQIKSGEFSLGMSLFGLPFLIMGGMLWGMALMAIAGKVRVRVRGDQGEIFTGVGLFGFRRRFSWNGVRRISRSNASTRYPGSNASALEIEGREAQIFGTGLNAQRQAFMHSVLRKMLAEHRPIEPLKPGTLSLAQMGAGDGDLGVAGDSGGLSKPGPT